jgi:hypothetical protein
MKISKFVKSLLGVAALIPALAFADQPQLVDVRVAPTDINLSSKVDKQTFVVQAVLSDSTTRDVTAEAKITLADAKLARVDGGFTVVPLKDGRTQLKIAYGGRSFELPVVVTNSAVTPELSFYQDVVPVFTKGGCNTGGCHGAARGKDGFRLSLFGFDPEGDYYRVTREQIGRRINVALPDDSLLLEKGAGRVAHTGNKLFDEDSELYQTTRAWIAAGAKPDSKDVAKVVAVDIYPKQAVMNGGTRQRLTVRARFSDGTDRDVTRLAAYTSNNDVAADVTDTGTIIGKTAGEAFVMARYDAFTVGTQVIVVPDASGFKWPAVPENNYVDTLVHSKLKKIRVTPSGLCDDQTFVRRVYLDVIGQLPTPETVKAFIANQDQAKRDKLIDELIKRPEFNDMWVMKFAELLQVRTENNQFLYKSAYQYFNWLKERFAEGVPMDELVKELLTANGDSFVNPAANFYKVETDTLKLTENVAQVFMGMRIQCAQCHNHPFDRWTMDDYYSFAAFFAQVGRKRGEDTRSTVVYDRRSGRVSHPVGNKDMTPKFLGDAQPEIKSGQDRRAVLAEWLASPKNPWFAKNLANIVWAHFMGKGIVEPVDDVRISNPPSNPELLEELGKQFAASDYNFRKLVADICKSRTYQLAAKSNASNADDERNFSKGYIRRLRAEVLLDTINQITDSPEKFTGLQLGSRAVEIVDGGSSTYFLTTFGRATRGSVCSCEVSVDPNLSQALHLLNGSTVNTKVSRATWLQEMIKAKKSPDEIVTEIYWRALSRPPSDAERKKLKEFYAEDPKEMTNAYYDIFWAVLNSKEFFFNH